MMLFNFCLYWGFILGHETEAIYGAQLTQIKLKKLLTGLAKLTDLFLISRRTPKSKTLLSLWRGKYQKGGYEISYANIGRASRE